MKNEFPIYRQCTDTFMCAIYSEDTVYTAYLQEGLVKKRKYEDTDIVAYYKSLFEHDATQKEWIELVKKAKEYQQKHFIDITWKESMEQNPTMADLTVKDYSRERLEEMNMGVREADEAERMELNEQNQD